MKKALSLFVAVAFMSLACYAETTTFNWTDVYGYASSSEFLDTTVTETVSNDAGVFPRGYFLVNVSAGDTLYVTDYITSLSDDSLNLHLADTSYVGDTTKYGWIDADGNIIDAIGGEVVIFEKDGIVQKGYAINKFDEDGQVGIWLTLKNEDADLDGQFGASSGPADFGGDFDYRNFGGAVEVGGETLAGISNDVWGNPMGQFGYGKESDGSMTARIVFGVAHGQPLPAFWICLAVAGAAGFVKSRKNRKN